MHLSFFYCCKSYLVLIKFLAIVRRPSNVVFYPLGQLLAVDTKQLRVSREMFSTAINSNSTSNLSFRTWGHWACAWLGKGRVQDQRQWQNQNGVSIENSVDWGIGAGCTWLHICAACDFCPRLEAKALPKIKKWQWQWRWRCRRRRRRQRWRWRYRLQATYVCTRNNMCDMCPAVWTPQQPDQQLAVPTSCCLPPPTLVPLCHTPSFQQLGAWRRPYVSFYIRCGVNKQTVFVYGNFSCSASLCLPLSFYRSLSLSLCFLSISFFLVWVLLIMASLLPGSDA